MVDRVDVSPEVIRWAKHRSRVDEASLLRRFPKLQEWEYGERSPTRKQLENFARATHVPVDYLLLENPPDEHIPIPDHRTQTAAVDAAPTLPSANLLDTIAQCQQRQDWYRAFAQTSQDEPPGFVATLSTDTPVDEAAADMREELEFDLTQRGPVSADALRLLSDKAEARGVLVMVNGVVGSNTRRKLDPEEFRGFALADSLVPLVFVNGADLKATQVFTLAHGLAHLWLGHTALSDADLTATPAVDGERWCSQVATEFLVPWSALAEHLDNGNEDVPAELEAVAKEFRVSPLVVLRRMHDAGRLDSNSYRTVYRHQLDALLERLGSRSGGGGNFYNTQPVRVSKRFARALLSSTLAGETPPNDAFQMLGFRKLSTLHELARRMGVS